MSSYVEVNVYNCWNACRDFLSERERVIAKRLENAIKEKMNRRWFPAKTPDEAIEMLKQDNGNLFTEWERIHLYIKNSAEIVEDLMAMCKNSVPDNIVISDKEIGIIGKYLKPERDLYV